MKKLKPDVADVDRSEQAWIDKYRAAISEPAPQPIFEKIVGRLGYVVGIILGKSKRLLTAAPRKPQPLEEIGIKSTKRKRKRDRGKFAA